MVNNEIFDYRKGLPGVHSVRTQANQHGTPDTVINLANQQPGARVVLKNLYLERRNPDIFVDQLTVQRLKDVGICALRYSNSQMGAHGVQ